MEPKSLNAQLAEYLTTDDVAGLCRTKAATVRYWRSIGTGPKGVRVGRRVLYRASDVQTWLDRRWLLAETRDSRRPVA